MYIYRCTTQNYADDVRYYVQVISDFCDIYCRRTSEAVVDEVRAANACFRPYMVCLVPCCTLLLTTSVLQVEHMVRFVSVQRIIKWPSTFVIGMVIYCTQKVKPIWILLKQETVSAVASAGPYESLHLTPDRQPHQHPTTLFFTGRMPFLPPNQQRQSTEGITLTLTLI